MNQLIESLSSKVISANIQKAQIEALQDELLKMEQADIVTEHHFYEGIYERTIIVPPWTVLTGAPHKTKYKVKLKKGTIAVNVGTEVKILTAPMEFEAEAGEQRVGRVFEEEVIWTDVYENADNCKDIEVLENRLYIVPECGLGANRQKLEYSKPKYIYCLKIDKIKSKYSNFSYKLPFKIKFGLNLMEKSLWQDM